MIATGGYFRGPELDVLPIRRVAQAVVAIAGDWKEGESPGVVVVFVVPGSLGDVNFSGLRPTLFSRKKKLLQIEAAVPKELVAAENIDDFAIDALRRAAQIAAEHFERKKAGVFDLAKANAVIDKVAELLAANGRPA